MTVSLKPATKVSEKLKGMLNNAIAREIQVSIQYMWQHVQVIGVKGVAVQDQFKKTAITEMRHAEKISVQEKKKNVYEYLKKDLEKKK